MIKKTILAVAITVTGSSLYAQAEKKDNIHMFPQAQKGFVRYVIEVPTTDNDYDHRVELLIGKVMLRECIGLPDPASCFKSEKRFITGSTGILFPLRRWTISG